ncbi:acyltransferase [Propioniciclava soli]|uniref:acyltransferase n=1 Tax=Propioniciclava soli TaxID=2775081 RepID=UPI001E596891|nr:acyltransferase [Propioniciclava soli]
MNVLRKIKWALGRRREAVEMVSLSVAAAAPVHRARVAALRGWGAQIHPTATIYHGFQARASRLLTIGARTIVGDGAILDARGGLRIGSDVNFSTGVQIWTAQHDWSGDDFGYVKAPVTIGDRAWLGPAVIVLPGTDIGEGVVLAAGAVAKGTLEPYGLYAGVPAKRIRDRPRTLTYHLPGPKAKAWWW